MRLAAFLLCMALVTSSWAAEEATPEAHATFLVIYRPGPSWPAGVPVKELPLREHGRFLLGLYAEGVMKQAGPFTDNSGGAVVLTAPDLEHAMDVVKSDPAVEAGLFLYEVRPWAPEPWEDHLQRMNAPEVKP